MKPVYFPFTYLSQPQLSALGACFDKIVVYQPTHHPLAPEMSRRADEGFLHIRVPGPADSDRIEKAIEDYRKWAQDHQGTPLSFFSTRDGTIPFFDSNSVSRIRSGIRGYKRETPSDQDAQDLIEARLFLSMAQQFDRHRAEVTHDLQSVLEAEKSLIGDLKPDAAENTGVPPSPMGAPAPADDTYMVGQRLKAWALLALQDPALPGLLVSCSPAVVEELAERIESVKTVGRIDAVSMAPASDDQHRWRKAMAAYFTRLQTDAPPVKLLPLPAPPATESTHAQGHLTIFRVEGRSPHQVVGDLCNPDRARKGHGVTTQQRSTIICLVTPDDRYQS